MLFLFSLAWCSSVFASSSQTPKHLYYAKLYVGERETHGNNRSPLIDAWNRAVGATLGSSYCASFVSHTLTLGNPSSPRVRSALARHLYSKAPSYLRYTASAVLLGLVKVRKGDILVWQRGETVFGHAGLASEDWNGTKGRTIEANTSSGQRGSQYNGNGVWERVRAIVAGAYFRIIGGVRVVYDEEKQR